MKICKLSVLLFFIQLLFIILNLSAGDSSCLFRSCYEDSQRRIPRPCIASPLSIAYMRNVSATSTCGMPASRFCDFRKCYECDASSTAKRHPPEFMVNSEFDTPYRLGQVTWWQSPTWWDVFDAKQGSSLDPLKVNVTLSFGRIFHISGGITVRFYNTRPKEMFLEKSKDFGKTWTVLQYFAFDCEKSSFNMPASPPVIKSSPFNVTCTEYFSGKLPPEYGQVEYRFDARYEPGCGYFDQDAQDLMLATNVRIRLEELHHGNIEIKFPSEANLNKYYYAISDIVITGRCNCNGHAQYCAGPRMEQTCVCEHNTAGQDCEKCKPLFNNHPWMPANATHANECEECQCNGHGLSCTYNETLDIGVCAGCRHNTTGQHCESCQSKFYRNSVVPINHASTCLACNCFPEGITNNGSCHQESTSTQVAGQCHCKNNVFGRRCGQCIPGYWGFTLSPRGECRECGCNSLGTFNNAVECDQYSGTCTCQPNIHGVNCSECKDGFYHFPSTNGTDCQWCPCNFGGALPVCNKTSGSCLCRSGVEGSSCDRAQQGRFYPFLDFIILEVEDMTGTFTTSTKHEGRGVAFTGTGYASFLSDQYAFTSTSVVHVSHSYYVVIRYSFPPSCSSSFGARFTLKVDASGFNESIKFDIFLDELSSGSGQAWKSPNTLKLFAGGEVNFTLIFNSSYSGHVCSFLVDSLVLIPDISVTRVFTESEQDVRHQLQSCVQARTSLPLVEPAPAYCRTIIFSVSTEIYSGTLACGCNAIGTLGGSSNCTSYGGQCSCRTGVVGRTCHSCDVGFYGFSYTGCNSCQCSVAGSVVTACHEVTGRCHCKSNAEGLKCNSCKPGTFNLDAANQHGCLHCFGYGHTVNCTSAHGFVSSVIRSQFVNETVFNWTVVNSTGNPVEFASSAFSGLVVTSPSSPSVVYIEAPALFLGTQYRSYGQRLHVKMKIRDPSNGHTPSSVNADVILSSGEKVLMLNLVPSPSPNITSYHVILHETHVINSVVTPLEFQSILAELTSIKILATYYPFPYGSVTFEEISLETAVSGLDTPGEPQVTFVENATCHMNYTGLSCEKCALGFTREVNGSGPFGRCILCSCNNRSTQCEGETGVCTNCQVGTYGDWCQLCSNNVQGPECTRCPIGYWGLSANGCQACECHTPGTAFGNDTSCDQWTGKCNCNATANTGGRRCATCKENSWNTSAGLFGCKECPFCYSYIQEDVDLLRVYITRLQAKFSSLVNQPTMVHNDTFNDRFHKLVTEVSELTQSLNVAREAESNATVQWRLFSVVMNDFNNMLNGTLAVAVNQTLHFTAIVEANKKETEFTVTQIRDLVTEASHLLERSLERKLEQAENSTSFLANQARKLMNLLHSMKREENRTLEASELIHTHVEHAVEVANKSAEMARNVTDAQIHLQALLRQLHKNASAIRVLGETAVTMASDKLVMANTAYNHSLQNMNEARQANPDRSSVLEHIKMESNSARDQFSRHHRQVSHLYQSGTAVMDRVDEAIESSVFQAMEVQIAYHNASQIYQRAQVTLTAARSSVSRTYHLNSNAQRMLQVVRNFEADSLRAQASASATLSLIPSMRNITHQIMQEVSAVNESSASALSLASEAWQLGRSVYNVSLSEKKVVERTLHLAQQLHRETSAKNANIDNSVENFIDTEIKPALRLCQNVSTMVANASKHSSSLLNRAAQTNTTAQRLGVLIMQLLNESSHLPRVNINNLPTLRREVSSAREQFRALQLGLHLAELRRGIQLQREKMTLYKSQIGRLRSSINEKKNLLRSMPQKTPCYEA